MSGNIEVTIVPPTISTDDSGRSGGDSAGIQPLDSLWEGRIETRNYPYVEVHATVDRGTDPVDESLLDRVDVFEEGERQDVASIDVATSALDLVFVFDDTGSMTGEIDAAKRRVTDLTAAIEERGIDAKYGLVTFKDDTEIDTPLTHDAAELKSRVDRLKASGGGDAPECNFDAIETALSFDFRDDANQVFVDITDALSHYRGDGSGYAEYTVGEVVEDLQTANVSFIAVSPGFTDERASVRTVAEEVGGLWTDIHESNFEEVLERITSLLTSTVVIRYHTCTPPGTTRRVRVEYEHPDGEADDDTAPLRVPERFDLPPECEENVDTAAETNIDARVSRELPSRGGETVLEVTLEPGRSAAELTRHMMVCVDTRAAAGADVFDAVLAAVRRGRDRLNDGDKLGLVAVDGTGVESLGLRTPSALSDDEIASLFERSAGSESQLSRAVDTAHRALTSAVRPDATVARIAFLTDGHGMRAGDDASDAYRTLANGAAEDGVTIDVGSIGSNPATRVVTALGEGSGGTITRLERPAAISPFLETVLDETERVVTPSPTLRIEPESGFALQASVSADETVYCRRETDGTVRTAVPPMSGTESHTDIHIPDLQTGQTQRVLLPSLGSPKASGLEYELADVVLLDRRSQRIVSDVANVTYAADPDEVHPEIERHRAESSVTAALTDGDFSKAEAEAKTVSDDAALRKRLIGRIEAVRDGEQSVREVVGKRRVE